MSIAVAINCAALVVSGDVREKSRSFAALLRINLMFVYIVGFPPLSSALISSHTHTYTLSLWRYDTVFLSRFSLHSQVTVVTFLLWRCGLTYHIVGREDSGLRRTSLHIDE